MELRSYYNNLLLQAVLIFVFFTEMISEDTILTSTPTAMSLTWAAMTSTHTTMTSKNREMFLRGIEIKKPGGFRKMTLNQKSLKKPPWVNTVAIPKDLLRPKKSRDDFLK